MNFFACYQSSQVPSKSDTKSRVWLGLILGGVTTSYGRLAQRGMVGARVAHVDILVRC